MFGFFDIMINSMVAGQMAQQPGGAAAAPSRKGASAVAPMAHHAAPMAHHAAHHTNAKAVGISSEPAAGYVWTQKGVDAAAAKGISGFLGNPTAGSKVTPSQRSMAENYGQWNTAIKQGWIQAAASPARKDSINDDSTELASGLDASSDDDTELLGHKVSSGHDDIPEAIMTKVNGPEDLGDDELQGLFNDALKEEKSSIDASIDAE